MARPEARPLALDGARAARVIGGSPHNAFKKRVSDVEAYLDHIPVLDPVLLALQPQNALVPAGGEGRAVGDEVVVGDDLGADEAAGEIRMDGPFS